MKKVVLSAVLLSFLLPATCLAARYRDYRPAFGPYLSAFLGVSAPRDSDVTGTDFRGAPIDFSERYEFDPSINVGGTAGFDLGTVRLEGELSYKHGEIANITESDGTKIGSVDGRVGALALLFNGWIDLHNNSALTPYVGGGLGFAAVHLSDTYGTLGGVRDILYFSDDDTVFAYQAGAGLGIALTRLVTLDIGYRYFGTSKARFNGTDINTQMKLESHNMAVGIRVGF